MEELYHRCHTKAPLEFIFTTNTGQVVEVKAEDLPVTSPYSPKYDPKAMARYRGLDVETGELPAEVVRFLKDKKLRAEDVDASTTDGTSDTKSPSLEDHIASGQSSQKCSPSSSNPLLAVSRTPSSSSANSLSSPQTIPVSMVYNEYGELVNAHHVLHPPHSKDMAKLEIMRIIKKGYHQNVSRVLVLHSIFLSC